MIDSIKSRLGDYAKDIRLNLGNIFNGQATTGLSEKQAYGIALASAYAAGDQNLANAILDDSQAALVDEDIHAIKGAVSVMSMNNVYYRTLHQISDSSYGEMPAGLRMMIIGNPGVDKVDFELYALAVSAINGCGYCVDSHVKAVRDKGLSQEGVQSCIKIAAIIQATSKSLMLE